jgi:hypothetical protein
VPPSKLVEILHKLSELEIDTSPRKGTSTYSVYIIEIENVNSESPFDFYVGSTGKDIEMRFQEHKNRGPKSARIFKNGKMIPSRICWEKMQDFPEFITREFAEQAENFVALYLAGQGLRVKSDKI